MADKKTDKKNASKIKDLKIELLKNPTKRGRIKKEIARLLTMEKVNESKETAKTKAVDTKIKSAEGSK
jgi:ribosomal protein L29